MAVEKSNLPHSPDAEKAILGAILSNPEKLNDVNSASKLEAEHFFQDNHRKIYQSILKLDAENKATDLITVAHELEISKESGEHNIGIEYLVELTESCPVSQNIEHYAEIVRKQYFLRKMIFTCTDVAKKASTYEGTLNEFIETVEKSVLEITNQQDKSGGLTPGNEIVLAAIEELEKRIASDSHITGVPSGFHDLDACTGGWQDSDLIILAARPGMGKTALALNWAMNGVKAGKTVAVFTLEMSKTQLMDRLISSEGRIDSSKMRKGDLTEEDQNRLMYAAKTISGFGYRLAIDETPSITLSELRSRCRRYHKEHGLDMVIIDYLQLMGSNSKSDSREREVSEISMGLKGLAKELRVPIITLAQLNRGPDSRTDKRPKPSDLRESGSIEQDADLIVFVYRDEYYNENSESSGVSEVIIAKNRHGEVDTVKLAFLPNFVSFHNLETKHGE